MANTMPPTLQKSRRIMSDTLFIENRDINFAKQLPPLSHLGRATTIPVLEFPITFDDLPITYFVKNPKGVTIADIALFVQFKVTSPLSEKEQIEFRRQTGIPNATSLLDVLGPRTRFGGLEVSPKQGSYCVWTIKFFS